jgi:hypothetical protein
MKRAYQENLAGRKQLQEFGVSLNDFSAKERGCGDKGIGRSIELLEMRRAPDKRDGPADEIRDRMKDLNIVLRMPKRRRKRPLRELSAKFWQLLSRSIGCKKNK